MAKTGYNAGNAFVTVAPSFKDFQQQIRDEVFAASKGLTVKVGIDADTAKLKAKLDAATKERTATVGVDADTGKAKAKIDETARTRTAKVKVDAEVDERSRAKTADAIKLLGTQLEYVFDEATKRFGDGLNDRIEKIRAEIHDLGTAHAAVEIGDAAANAKLNEIKRKILELGTDTGSALIRVEADTSVAEAEIDEAARNRTSEIKVDADTAAADTLLKFEARDRNVTFKAHLDRVGLSGSNVFSALGNFRRSIRETQKELRVGQFFSSAGTARLLTALSPVFAPAAIGGIGAIGGAALAGGGALGAFGAGAIANIVDITKAQNDLKTAREQAAAASIAAASAENTLISAEQAVGNAQIAVKDAQIALTDARRDATRALQDLTDNLKAAALAESGAKLSVKQALVSLREVQDDPTSTRLQIEQALQGLREARLRSDQARVANRRAQIDGARAVRQGVEGNEAVRAAAERLAQAQQQVADAQRAVAIAQAQKAKADTDAAKAQTALAKAQAVLKPQAAQDFEAALKGIAVAWHALGRATQEATLKPITDFLGIIKDFLPRLAPISNAAATAVSSLVDAFGGFLNSPFFSKMMDDIKEFGPSILKSFGRGTLNLIKGFLIIFDAFIPLGDDFGKGFQHMTREFVKWAREFTHSKQFQQFVDFVKTNTPLVLSLIGQLVQILAGLLEALGPVVQLLLEGLVPALDLLSNVDPTTLLGFAAGIALLIDPIYGAIFAIAFLTKLMIDAYNKSQEFRDGVNSVGDSLSEMWTNLLPTLQDLFDQLMGLFVVFEKFAVDFWQKFGDSIMRYVSATVENIALVLGGVIQVIKGIFEIIDGLITGDWSEIWDGLKDIVKGAVKIVGGLLRQLQNILWLALDTIATLVWTSIKGQVNLLIDGINKLIDGINWLTHWVGIPPLHHFSHWGPSNPTPPANNAPPPTYNVGVQIGAAQGGVLPGFTPGIDVHHFYSPTAGRLDLSGGEGILIPQATAMMGGREGIAAINRAARRGFRSGGTFENPAPPTGGFSGASEHIPFRGVTLDEWTIRSLLAAEHLLGQMFHLTQGSFSTGVAASAGTHAGGGAFDATFPWTVAATAALRRANFAAWQRNPSQGPWPNHIHAILMGDPMLSPQAAAQVRAYLAGGNGLGGPDDGPHVGPAYGQAAITGTGGGGSGGVLAAIGGGITKAYEIAQHAFSWLWDKFTGVYKDTNPVTHLLTSVMRKAVGLVADHAKDLLFNPIKGAAIKGLDIIAGPGTPVVAEQNFARSLFGLYGWGADQFGPLNLLWIKESGWNPLAKNPSSGAYGIPQALPGNKMSGFGLDWRTNPFTQIRWGEWYIHDRYGTPANAWAHSQATGWYDGGGVAVGSGYLPKNIVAPERVLGPSSTRALDEALRNLGTAQSGKPQRIVLDLGSGRTLTGYMTDIADGAVNANNRWQYGNGVAR